MPVVRCTWTDFKTQNRSKAWLNSEFQIPSYTQYTNFSLFFLHNGRTFIITENKTFCRIFCTNLNSRHLLISFWRCKTSYNRFWSWRCSTSTRCFAWKRQHRSKKDWWGIAPLYNKDLYRLTSCVWSLPLFSRMWARRLSFFRFMKRMQLCIRFCSTSTHWEQMWILLINICI